MPDKPAHDWESLASRKKPLDGGAGAIPPGSNGSDPGETPPQDGKKAPRIGKFDWGSLASRKTPPQDSQKVPSINDADRESLASDTTPRGGKTEQHSSSPDRKGPVPDRTSSTDRDASDRGSSSDRMSSQDRSASYRSMPSGRKDPASRRPSPQREGAGNLTRLLQTGYFLLPLSIIALVVLHYLQTSSPPYYDAERYLSRAALRMLMVLVGIGPAVTLPLLALWRARRENNAGAAAHARALLLTLLYGADACLLWILSVESDPGPAGPVESAGFAQVLEFIIEFPARLFSWIFLWSAILLGYRTVLRAFKGCMALREQKSPGSLVRYGAAGIASFLPGIFLFLFCGALLLVID